jgi:co-chaperonin GroES (HSP10)|tara:strand:- start:553 stop:981 length:429 start_codon:yes stop_codon:yes gene_type:complete
MTSSILLATDASNPQVVGSYNFASTAEEKGKLLPKPSGYRILCAIPEAEKEFEDSEIGLIKADETMRNEETLTTVLFVVDMGPDCYKDPARFPNGAYCQKGDFVLVRPHAGTRLVIHGREFRIINDDSVEGTVDDPRGIKRK